MKNIFALFLLAALSLFSVSTLAVPGRPALPLPDSVKYRLNTSPTAGPSVRLGSQLTDRKIQLLRAIYDYSVLGAPSATPTPLKDINGGDAVLPKGAVIKSAMLEVLTSMAQSGNSVVFDVGVEADGDVVDDAAVASLTAGALVDGEPDGTAANAVKVTGNKALYIKKVSGDTVTAGKFNVFVEYYISD